MKKILYLSLTVIFLLGIIPLPSFAQTTYNISKDGLDLWLKADAGITMSAGAVTGWASQIGSASFSASGSGQAVTLEENSETGYKYLKFNGTGSLTAVTENYTGKNAITLIAVAEYEGNDPGIASNADTNTALFWTESGSWGSMSLAPYKNHVQMRFGAGSSAGISKYSRTAIPGLSSYIAAKNGGTHSLMINNEEVLKETGKPEVTSGIGTTMYIGQGISANTDKYFSGKIAEVLVYNRVLTSAELGEINAYFADKYGIDVISKEQASLAVTPPSKLQYNVGESFESVGMSVSLRYTNGETEALTPEEYNISGFDSSLKGKQTITVSLKSNPSVKGSFTVSVAVGDSLKIVSAAAAPVSVPKGTAADRLILPFSVDATLDGYFTNVTQPTSSTKTKIPVVWDTTSFDPNLLNTPQTIKGTLNITLAKATQNDTTKTDYVISNPNGVKAEIKITVRDVEREIYVNPTASTGGDGTKDSPFRSIHAAKEAIVLNGWNSDMKGDILVWLGGGTYRISEPIEFDTEDSGSNGFSIIYQAVSGEVPNINGGITVDEWQRWDKNPNIYVANLNRDKKLRNLFVNGKAAKMTSATVKTCGPYGRVEINGDEDWALDAGVETAGVLLNFSEIGFNVSSPEDLTNPDDIEIRQKKIWNEVTVGVGEIKSVTPGDDGGAPPPKASSDASNMWTDPGNEVKNKENLDKIINSEKYIARRNQGDTAFILQQPYGAIASCLTWQCGFQPYFAELNYKGNSISESQFQEMVIQNSLELLRNPGEFYFDKKAHKLYYYPKNGENIHMSEIVAPVSEGLIRIHGKNTSDRVENLQFSGIKFTFDDKGLERVDNSEGFASTQNMAVSKKYARNGDYHKWLYNMTDIPKGTVDVENARGIVFDGNIFTTLSGSTCVGYINDVTESYITGNLFIDTAGNSACIGHTQHVHIGEAAPPETLKDEKYPVGVEGVCKDIIVSNNHIENVCTMYTQADSLTALFVENVEFSHNKITNVPYAGINFGWGWQNQDDRADYRGTHYPDYPSKTARKNVIAYNDISRANQVLTRDGGALYVVGQQEDSIIAYNNSHGWRSIYLDEGTAHYEVFNNNHDTTHFNDAYNDIWYRNLGEKNALMLVRNSGRYSRVALSEPFSSGHPSADTISAGAGVSPAYSEDIEYLKGLLGGDDWSELLSYDFEDQITGAVSESNNELIAPFVSGGLSIEEEDGNKVLRINAASGSTGHHGFYLKDKSWQNALIEMDFKCNVDHNFTHAWEALSVQGYAQASDLNALANTENLFAAAFFDKSNIYKYHSNTGVAGQHTNGASIPFTLAKETWYSIKIMTKDGVYYTKVWDKNGAEPSDWQLSGNIPSETGNKGTLRVKTYKHNSDSVIDMSFDNIKVDIPVQVELPDNLFTITFDEGIENGFVAVNRNHDLPPGTSVTVTAIPDTGYVTRQILINGVPIGFTDNKVSFEITEDTIVSAIFEKTAVINSITPDRANNKVTINLSSSQQSDAMMIVAVYSNKKLLSLKTEPVVVTESGDMVINNFIIPSEADTIKAMVWGGWNTMQPLAPSLLLEITGGSR